MPLAIFLIAFIGILIYSNTFLSTFHYDDFHFIVENESIRNLQDLHTIWHYFHGRFITFLSFALNYHFNGAHVLGYHMVNVAIHLCTAIMVYWLCLLTFSTPAMKDEPISRHSNLIGCFSALIFVAHPLQIEAVTYIWQRAASMAAMFYLAALCCYIKARLILIDGTDKGLGFSYYRSAIILALLAMFSKENSVTLPLMALIYEWVFLNSKKCIDWNRSWPFCLTIVIIPMTLIFTKTQKFQVLEGNINSDGVMLTSWTYFCTEIRVMLTYLRLCILPFHQNVDYDYPIYQSIFVWPVFISFLFLGLIGYLTKQLLPHYRILFFFVIWFFITLTIPESSFWVLREVIFEHRMYLPMVGGSIFIVTAMFYILANQHLKILKMSLVAIIACLAVLTFQRNEIWKTEKSLWNDAVLKSPHKARPYNNRAVGYILQGEYSRAMNDLNRAIQLNPKFVLAYCNRGDNYLHVGKYELAIADYNKAIALDPKNTKSYWGRATAYYSLKQKDKAMIDLHHIQEIGNANDLWRAAHLLKTM